MYELDKLKNWAKDLLIIQYHEAIKNKQLIELMVELIFANRLIEQIRDLCLNLKQSIGVQLDVVGKWLGINRNYSGEYFEKVRFALPSYSQIKTSTYFPAQGGFSNYTNFETLNGGFLMYKEWYETFSAVNKLGDELFRKLCELKAIKNAIAYTNKNISEAIYKWSNGDVYVTWGDMECTYHYPVSYYQLMNIANDKKVLLAPSGVKIILEEYI